MGIGQKIKTACLSMLPAILCTILLTIVSILPLYFSPGLSMWNFYFYAGSMLISVVFGFLLLRRRKEITPKVLKDFPTSNLLPPVMAALFLYAANQLLDTVIYMLSDGPEFSIPSDGNFLDYLKAIGGSNIFPTGWQTTLYLLLLVPVVDALLTRYFPIVLCKHFASVPKLCIGSGVVFMLLHLPGLRSAISTFLLCTVLALVYLKTGSLWHSILAHIIFNATTLIPQFSYAFHTSNNTGYTGIVWIVIQLVFLAVPIIWFIRQLHTKESTEDAQ